MGWVVFFTTISRGVQYLTLLILAGILQPHDFGAFAVGMLLITALNQFRDMGLTPALVQRRDNVERAFRVALILIPVLGILLYILVFFAAIPFALFMGDPTLTPMLRVMGLAVPISSFGLLPAAYFQREIAFQRKAAPEIISITVGSLISLAAAWKGMGIWSLVAGQIITETLRTISYWISLGWKWKPLFDLQESISLFRFGGTVSLGSLATFLYQSVDQLVVGKYLGQLALGFYSFAFKAANIPVTNLAMLIHQVMLPVLSKLQGARESFVKAYLKYLSIMAFATTPLCIGLFLFGGEILNIIYQGKWDSAAELIRILAVYGLVRSVGGTMGNVYISLGRPVFFFLISASQAVSAGLLVIWIVQFDSVYLIALLFTGIMLLGQFISFFIGARLMRTTVWKIFRQLLPYAFAAAVGFLALKAIETTGAGIILRISGFYIIYFAGVLLFGMQTIRDFFQLAKSAITTH